jgi:hypothetical protein
VIANSVAGLPASHPPNNQVRYKMTALLENRNIEITKKIRIYGAVIIMDSGCCDEGDNTYCEIVLARSAEELETKVASHMKALMEEGVEIYGIGDQIEGMHYFEEELE